MPSPPIPSAPPVSFCSVVARMRTAVANPSVPTSWPSVSRSAISHPTTRPARPATTVARAAQTRNCHGSPNGQSTFTNSTPKAYIPMPQNPTTPKLAIRASPSCRWSSSARPITMTTSNSPETRNAVSQSGVMALHLPRLREPPAPRLQDGDEDDDQRQLRVQRLAGQQRHGCQRHARAQPDGDDAAQPPAPSDEDHEEDEEELPPAKQRRDGRPHSEERAGQPPCYAGDEPDQHGDGERPNPADLGEVLAARER